jgi:trk system potassium uptake protein
MAPQGHKSLYIVIVGCGRLGADLANRLSAQGHALVVIDRDESTFRSLTAEYSGFRLEGDATEMEVLRQAKLSRADVFIASTSDDNVNLMVAQIAQKLFHVPQVLARVWDPKRDEAFARLGVETVCPTSVASGMLLDAILGSADSHAGRQE